jgi:hypothetical protein
MFETRRDFGDSHCLVVETQTMREHVLNMHGIVTFKGVNIHLIRGVVVVPFNGVGIAAVLIDIEGPRE